jgi:hypothetical protein
MPEKYVPMISKRMRKPKNSQPLQNWLAAAADIELPEATFAWCPLRGASGDYCAWDATDEICANARPAYANGKWTALQTLTRTIQARRNLPVTIAQQKSSSSFDARNRKCDA